MRSQSLPRQSGERLSERAYDKKDRMNVHPAFCREEATRTPDPYVPNVVRYQLRYFSKKKDAKYLASSLFAFTAYASLLM